MSRFIQLVGGPIDVGPLQSKVNDPDVGAHSWFYGVTRRTTETKSGAQVTDQLSYEAHEPMAIRQLEEVADRATEKFGLAHVVIVHRLGDVPIGEASVVVGASSAHRNATFDALRWIMEMLKRDVPIWKRESFADGTRQWVHPTEDPS